ncbi:MAG: hypothetical protein M1819_005026 [Sarea resinae]|nr:MAG: hypothetical protein M1819_005026 [Sarea resinae]
MKRSAEAPVSPPPVRRKLQSTTTKGAVAKFFTPASKKDPDPITWRIVDNSLLIGRYAPASSEGPSPPAPKVIRIAAFDFDSTLIQSSSGNKFAKNAQDWKWWNPVVPGKLSTLHTEGYLVVVLSNQGGISLKSDPKSVKSDQKRLADFKEKVLLVFQQLDFPVTIYAATSRDQYRKPRTGMWKEMLEDYDLEGADSVDIENSFLVGDAAGRTAESKQARDHSCSDRDFACNIGIRFHTPEEFFLKEDPRPFTRDFDPPKYMIEQEGKSRKDSPEFTKRNELDIILFCGSPGAGKSTFYWNYLKPLGYERVNQDTLKTRDKCIEYAKRYISDGISVAVDNTNADKETRAKWLQVAKQLEVPMRCVYFTAPVRLCEHNDVVRALNGEGTNPEKRIMLPKIAFTGFASRFREPATEEGFQDITRIDFRFEGNDEHRAAWTKYWVS